MTYILNMTCGHFEIIGYENIVIFVNNSFLFLIQQRVYKSLFIKEEMW